MANLTRTAADAILKDLYAYEDVAELAFKRKDNALFAMLAKGENMSESMEGRRIVVPIRVTRPMGRSADFATAQASATASNFKAFLVTPVQNYGVAGVDGITIASTKSNRGAFIKALTSEIDGVIEEVVRDAAKNLYRGQSGSLGTAGAISTTRVTLTNVLEASNFELGMEIVAAADEAVTTALRDSGQANTITGIDRVLGYIDSTDDWSTISSFAPGDHMFCKGDASNNSTYKKMAGLTDWVLAASSATAFFGVDRSSDSRLWGTFHNGSSETIDTALFNAQSEAKQLHGGSIDKFFMNPKNLRELVSQLGSKVEYAVTPANGGSGPIGAIGFEAIKIHGDAGTIQVYSDINCQVGLAWGLQMDTWKLWSMGQMPRILDEDGLRIERQASADGYEVRVGYYGNLVCANPGANVRVLLP